MKTSPCEGTTSSDRGRLWTGLEHGDTLGQCVSPVDSLVACTINLSDSESGRSVSSNRVTTTRRQEMSP